MKSEILHVLSYFDFFDYAPTFEEIYVSLRVKSSIHTLEIELEKLVRRQVIQVDEKRYAMNKETILVCKKKRKYSQKLKQSFEDLYSIFTYFPCIQFIGISGSLSMLDAESGDDIDLFVVTSQNTIWLSRFYILLITRIMAIMGNSVAKQLCWNIFIEEQNLTLPMNKQNEYTAHELLQLKTVYDSSDISQKLIGKNRWVLKILPNVQINSRNVENDYRLLNSSKAFTYVDRFFRYFQLRWLNKKGYKAVEYPSQVWFIQNDFEKKIPIPLKKI